MYFTQFYNFYIVYGHSIDHRERRNIADASIFGAELKTGTRLCVNYLKHRDLYEKKIIFTILNNQVFFQINKYAPPPLVSPKLTNKQVNVWVAFGRKRPFTKNCP